MPASESTISDQTTSIRATEMQIDAAEAEYSYRVNCANSPFLNREEIRSIVEEALNSR